MFGDMEDMEYLETMEIPGLPHQEKLNFLNF